MLKTVEPYIADEMALLSVQDLVNAYIGFSHPHSSQPFEVLSLIEARLINGVNDLSLGE